MKAEEKKLMKEIMSIDLLSAVTTSVNTHFADERIRLASECKTLLSKLLGCTGLSQARLGDKIGLGQSQISNLLNDNHSAFSIEKLLMLSFHLEMLHEAVMEAKEKAVMTKKAETA